MQKAIQSHNQTLWNTVQLGDCGELYCGQSSSVAEVNAEGRGQPYFTGPEQWDGQKLHVDKWTEHPRRVVPDGCIFITVKGAGVGKLFPGLAGAIGRDIYAYRVHPSLDFKYLYYALRHTIDGVVGQAKGDIPGLSKNHILDHAIPLPSVAQQRRIVAKIEELFSELDKGVESLTNARQQFKAYRQSVLKAAFEGEMTADWRTKRPGYNWTHGRFGDYFKLQGGYAFKSDDYCDAGVPLIRIGDIQGDRVAPSEKTALLPASYLDDNPSFVVTDGDILVAMSGATTGKFGIYTGQQRSLLNQRVGRVLARQSGFEIPRILVWYFLMRSQPEILRRAYGGAQPNISSKGIEDLEFSFPSSKEEMILLVSRLETALSRNDETSEMIGAELLRSESLRQSILKRAFSGQLVAQDPRDEPASVLLERIRAEREEGNTTKRRNKNNGKKEAA